MKDLEQFRQDIDETDRELVALLVKRMGISREIGAYKKERGLKVYDPEREKLIIERLRRSAGDDPAIQDAVAQVYERIFEASIGLQ